MHFYRMASALFALTLLCGSGSASGLDSLLKKLSHSNPVVRSKAARALGSLGTAGKDAVPALTKLLHREPWQKTRKSVASALAQIGSASVPSLIKALESPKKEVVTLAFWALETLGPDGAEAISALRRGLQSKSDTLRRRCAKILAEMGPQAKEAVEDLVKLLADTEVVRRQAIATLRKMGPEAIGALRKGLSSKNATVQYYSAVLLGLHGAVAKQAIADLGKLLSSPEVKVRLAALTALGEMGSHPKSLSGPLVRRMLEDPNKEVQDAAGIALINIGKPVAKDLGFWLSLVKSDAQKIRILLVLSQIGEYALGAAPGLMPLLRDKSAEVRRMAVMAIGSMGIHAVKARADLMALEKDPDMDVRISAALALATIFPNDPVIKARLDKELKRSVYGKPSAATAAQYDRKLQARIEQYLNWYVTVNDTNFGKGLTKGSKRAISQLGPEAIPAIVRTLNKLHSIPGGKLEGPKALPTPQGALLLGGKRTYYYI